MSQEENDTESVEFLKLLSHEARNYLYAALIPLQSVLAKIENEDVRRAAQSSIRSIESLRALMEDIFTRAHYKRGHFDLRAEPFSLFTLLRRIEDLYAASAAVKHMFLACRVHPGCPDRFIGDEYAISRILAEFISNALKYSERGTISVEASYGLAESMLHMAVSDDGIGIKPEDLPRIFDKSVRAERTASEFYLGEGLGLYICKLLVLHMGGRIWANSIPGSGSSFHFTIPLKVAS